MSIDFFQKKISSLALFLSYEMIKSQISIILRGIVNCGDEEPRKMYSIAQLHKPPLAASKPSQSGSKLITECFNIGTDGLARE